MDNCRNCCKNLTCDRKQCDFKSWINTINYGEPRIIDDNEKEEAGE